MGRCGQMASPEEGEALHARVLLVALVILEEYLASPGAVTDRGTTLRPALPV